MVVQELITYIKENKIPDFGKKEGENIQEYFKYILKDIKQENKLFLELGVFTGFTSWIIANHIKGNKLYGFDTFTGLPEDWKTSNGNVLFPKNTFDTGFGVPHSEKNVEFIQGLVEDTLPAFLSQKNIPVKFVHLDLDLYNATKVSLLNLYKYLDTESIVVLDDVYNFPNYEEFAIKAFVDTLDNSKFNITPIATISWYEGWSNIALKLTRK